MNNKTIARSLIILSVLAIFMEGCYLFCLFRPDNAIEEAIEHFVEEEFMTEEEKAAPPEEATPKQPS